MLLLPVQCTAVSLLPCLSHDLKLFLLFRFKRWCGFPRISWEPRNSWTQRRARIHGSSRTTRTTRDAWRSGPPRGGAQRRPRPPGTTWRARWGGLTRFRAGTEAEGTSIHKCKRNLNAQILNGVFHLETCSIYCGLKLSLRHWAPCILAFNGSVLFLCPFCQRI